MLNNAIQCYVQHDSEFCQPGFANTFGTFLSWKNIIPLACASTRPPAPCHDRTAADPCIVSTALCVGPTARGAPRSLARAWPEPWTPRKKRGAPSRPGPRLRSRMRGSRPNARPSRPTNKLILLGALNDVRRLFEKYFYEALNICLLFLFPFLFSSAKFAQKKFSQKEFWISDFHLTCHLNRFFSLFF